jgi:uncharacterized protein YjbI with pentapeptide repeats
MEEKHLKKKNLFRPMYAAANMGHPGAAFTDVNFTGASISVANLSKPRISETNVAGASIVDSMIDEMTINGVSVKELFAEFPTRARSAWPSLLLC